MHVSSRSGPRPATVVSRDETIPSLCHATTKVTSTKAVCVRESEVVGSCSKRSGEGPAAFRRLDDGDSRCLLCDNIIASSATVCSIPVLPSRGLTIDVLVGLGLGAGECIVCRLLWVRRNLVGHSGSPD